MSEVWVTYRDTGQRVCSVVGKKAACSSAANQLRELVSRKGAKLRLTVIEVIDR